MDLTKEIQELHKSLQKLIGLHRQLLESVRSERDGLLSADVKVLQETTNAKEALIEAIKRTESERMGIIGALALSWKRPARELSLSNVIIAIQGEDLKSADLLRSSQNALNVLIQRITEQNAANKQICDRSLGHLDVMKKNVLGEGTPRSDVYSQQGQRVNGPTQSRLLSREA